MNLRKPYIKKPLMHTPRELEFLAKVKFYLVQTPTGLAEVTDPGQCVAALRAAKQRGVRCLIQAVGTLYGEDSLIFVDEDFLLKKIGEAHEQT